MDMMQALTRAAEAVGTARPFGSRDAFAKRVGKHQIFPVGLGSALEKAVRVGYLRISSEGSRRKGRAYEFTMEGKRAVDEHRIVHETSARAQRRRRGGLA